MKINIDRAGLKAALLFAAKTDIRYYLNGVQVQATATATRINGCNGHVLSMHHTTQENEVSEPVSLIIPRKVVELLPRPRARERLSGVYLKGEGLDWELVDMSSGIRLGFKPIEGKYPDTMKVVPRKTSGEFAYYNPVYVSLLGQAAAAFKQQSHQVAFHHNGESAAIARIIGVPAWLAVVMPMKDMGQHTSAIEQPAWLDQSMTLPAQTEIVELASASPEAQPA